MAADARGLARAGAAAVALLVALAASAHRGHAVWTDIVWNGEYFEVTHRMHLADAITVSTASGGGNEPIAAPRSLARVALYVEEHFRIVVEGEAVTLDTLGAEIEDDFLFVYQEWHGALPAVFPAVDNSVLLDVEPESQAFIRIQGPGIAEERRR